MTEQTRNIVAAWWSRRTAGPKGDAPATQPAPRQDAKTDHIRQAVAVIGGFLAIICLVVLVKGVISAPRAPRTLDATVAAAPAHPESGLSAYQEKLEQYRQSQPHDANPAARGTGGNGTAAAVSPEDAQFVKQQLRLPMLVKEAQAPGVPSAVPPEAPAPVVHANPALDQRLAELRQRLGELKEQQRTMGGVP